MSKEFKFNEPAIGMDGEFFLVDAGGHPISAVGLVGGEKGRPIPCDGGGYLEDCVAVEINPYPVPFSQGREIFADNIALCIEEVRSKIKKLNLDVCITPTMLFDKDSLASDQAMVSGCSPSFDAWSVSPFVAPDLSKTFHRFASGDLHLSWDMPTTRRSKHIERINTIRLLDLVMSAAEVCNTHKSKRSQAYGQPGIHRTTPYGVEYKSVSNFWMEDRSKMMWAYDIGKWVIEYVTNHRSMRDDLSLGMYNEHVHRMINTWDKKRASVILENFDAPRFPA